MFSPVTKHETFRFLAIYSAKFKYKMKQYDLKMAILHGDLDGKIYMRLPELLYEMKHYIFKILGEKRQKNLLYDVVSCDKRSVLKLNQ